MKSITHLLFAAALLLPAMAAAATPLPEGTYVYSDFCAGPNPWNVAGHRVEWHHTAGGDDVLIEFNEGGSDAGPIVADPVHFDAATGALDFSYQTQADEYAFDGIAAPDRLTGTFEYDQQPITLPRQPDGATVKARCAASR